MTIKDAVVQRIRQLCGEREMSVNELANRSGVTPSSVYSMLDSKRREMTVNLIMKLCDGFDITITEFFNCDIFLHVESEV